DLLECCKLINSYNEFDSDKIALQANLLNRKKYYNLNNPNNGSDLFKFEIGREGSPVIYVHFHHYVNNHVISNGCVDAYSVDNFKSDMAAFAKFVEADEFSIDDEN